jgi:hypothetical protein
MTRQTTANPVVQGLSEPAEPLNLFEPLPPKLPAPFVDTSQFGVVPQPPEPPPMKPRPMDQRSPPAPRTRQLPVV